MSELARVQELRQKIKADREALNERVKTAFHEEAKALFVRHPELEGFRWTQYTPYFNDGDTCEFGAHTDDPQLKMKAGEVKADAGPDDEDDDSADGYADFYGAEENTPVGRAGKAVTDFLGAFDDDDYKAMFDDHARVTVTREGVQVDEYEHD